MVLFFSVIVGLQGWHYVFSTFYRLVYAEQCGMPRLLNSLR